VLTTLFSFSLLAVYAILMTLSVRRAETRGNPGGDRMETAIVTGSWFRYRPRRLRWRLASDGYRVTVNDTSFDQAESVASQIRSDGGEG